MTKYAQIVNAELNPKATPQNKPIPGKEAKMHKNAAGGYVFSVDQIGQATRFLILGSPTTYYVTEEQSTLKNAQVIIELAKANGVELVKLIERVNTTSTREDGTLIPAAAPRKAPGLFALAICKLYGDDATRRAVYAAIERRGIISTLSQMFDFLNNLYTLTSGGKLDGSIAMGSGFKRALNTWLQGSPESAGRNDKWLAMQAAKYRHRSYQVGEKSKDGTNKKHEMDMRDFLRLTHPKPQTESEKFIFAWAVQHGKGQDEIKKLLLEAGKDGKVSSSEAYNYLMAFETAQATDDPKEVIRLIHQYGLTHEMIPNTWFSDKDTETRANVWRALIGLPVGNSSPATYADGNVKYEMGLTAFVRNLPRFSAYGLLNDKDVRNKIVNTLSDSGAMDRLVKGRIHPIQLLSALRIHERGYTERQIPTKYGGTESKRNLEWKKNQVLADALESAFYLSFGAIEPSGVREGYFFDVSGSMFGGEIAGVQGLTPAEAEACMAMVMVRQTTDYVLKGFTSGISRYSMADSGMQDLAIGKHTSLGEAVRVMRAVNWGGTDCALPFIWAEKNKEEIDCFYIWTDSETWAGRQHPSQALKSYRKAINPNARVGLVAMTATEGTINDPDDKLCLDVIGFDSSAPSVLTSFARGEI